MTKGVYLTAALCSLATGVGMLLVSLTHSDLWLLYTVAFAVLSGMIYQEIMTAGKSKHE